MTIAVQMQSEYQADEGQLGRILELTVILLSVRSDNDGMRVLRAAQAYKVDVDAISGNAREEIAKKARPPGERATCALTLFYPGISPQARPSSSDNPSFCLRFTDRLGPKRLI